MRIISSRIQESGVRIQNMNTQHLSITLRIQESEVRIQNMNTQHLSITLIT